MYVQPRTTKDLDVFVRVSESNSDALFAALKAFGAPLSGLSPEDFRDGATYQMGQPPFRIDIIQQIDGVDFGEAWETRRTTLVNGAFEVPVISPELLVRNKLSAGRDQDLLDAKVIQKVLNRLRKQ